MKKDIVGAISQLEHEILNINEMITIDPNINHTLSENIINNKRLSIKALQEQLDRLEGCDKCKSMMGSTVANKDCVVEYNFYNSDHSEKTVFYLKNNYCSECGRKLRGGEDEKL